MIRFILLQWRGIVSAVIAASLGFFVYQLGSLWFFFGSIVLWGIYTVFLTRSFLAARARIGEVGLIFAAFVAMLLLMSLTEWRFVTRGVMILGSISIGSFVSMLFAPYDALQVYVKKAFRRIFVMGWVFVCSASMIAAHATAMFFPNIPALLIFLLAGIVASVCAYAVWRLYYPLPVRRFSLWLLIMAVVTMEIFWAMQLLPFGYIVLGCLTAWVWYTLLLLLRFHMSVDGIHWKKQRTFLISNAVLFTLVLFVIRWI